MLFNLSYVRHHADDLERGIMHMNIILILHIFLVIICIIDVNVSESKISKILWSCSGLCWLICVILDLMKMM